MSERRVRRLRRVRWRDTRLWIGIGLVVAAMVLGSRLLSAGEERTLVWAATGDLAIGSAPNQIELVPVTLGGAEVAYFSADERPTGQLLSPVAAGALVPRSALIEPDATVRFVTIGIEPAQLPPDLAPGQLVDVWVTTDESLTELVKPGVVVHAVNTESGGVRTGVTVVVQVAATDVGPLITAMRSGALDLVAVPVT
jgi:hypothetical protein